MHNSADQAFGGLLVFIFVIGLMAFIAAVIVFCVTNPVGKADAYVNMLASHLPDPNDQMLLRSLYQQRGSKSILTAWLFSVFFSPTIAYVYLNDWPKAVIALLTLQGAGLWWWISWFTMPYETLAVNKRAADEAFNQIRLMRPQFPPGAYGYSPQPGAPPYR